jgi:hypothetical protein
MLCQLTLHVASDTNLRERHHHTRSPELTVAIGSGKRGWRRMDHEAGDVCAGGGGGLVLRFMFLLPSCSECETTSEFRPVENYDQILLKLTQKLLAKTTCLLMAAAIELVLLTNICWLWLDVRSIAVLAPSTSHCQ